MSDCAFDIVILAGQSNAEGFGYYKQEDCWKSSGKVMQLVDSNKALIYEDPIGSGNGVMELTLPTVTKLEIAHDRISDGYAYADMVKGFTDGYISSGLLKEGRKILVIKAALGGAGFAKKQWGVGKPLFIRLNSMIDDALSLNNGSKVVAFLWHQGEHDAFENADFSEQERYGFYYKSLREQTLKIRERFDYSVPFIAGGFVSDWASEFKGQCDTVERALKDVCNNIGDARFVGSEGLLSNREGNNGVGDNIHFCYKSINELGKRYFDKYLEIIKSR